MRQVVQNFRSGELRVRDVPPPGVRPGQLLVANVRSLISAGTEKSTVNVAKKSLLGKALEKPQLARKVLDKAFKDGIAETAQMVFQRLDTPVALGYSCAGYVIGVGAGVQGFAVGDRVACAGQNHASHAEFVAVPANLCTPIPDGVDFDAAAYVTLGAIALQGVRQADPKLGEVIVVLGLGLLGQLAVQMLKANGCRVLASDVAEDKLAMARRFGADDAVIPERLPAAAAALTGGQGVDAVLIAASTRDNGPVEVAGEICRRKGRVVVLGAVGMNLPREPYYLKELELRLSTSYGPGRYDPAYEEQGHDYPYGYVRWTEGRNMQAFLWLVASGKVDVATLTTHRFDIEDAEAAYALMLEGGVPYLGILLRYAATAESRAVNTVPATAQTVPRGGIRLGLIGVGNHVQDRLLGPLRKIPGVHLDWVCAGTGVNADAIAGRLGVARRTTDYRQVLDDPAVNAVLIGTRHGSHARQVCAALAAGKHVFVEKPLCLTLEELDEVRQAYAAAPGLRLMVGFNRRYSSHALEARRFFADRREPLVMVYRANAGAIPPTHWAQDPASGGGRIIGEACHFLDFMQFVCGARPVTARGEAIARHSSGITSDHSILTFGFADGSIGTIVYAAGGDGSLAKERFEAFGAGRALTLDDFLETTLHVDGRTRRFRSGKRDKGFAAEMTRFCHELDSSDPSSMPFADIVAVSSACILAAQSLQTGEACRVPD
jgi:predicted dehydrogenase/threonine dehydrogenase-like Zn-dependent dehydrogenase